MPAESDENGSKRLLLCGFYIVRNSNGPASFEDIAVIFIEWLGDRAKIG